MKQRKRQPITKGSLPTNFNRDFEVMIGQYMPYLRGIAFSILRDKEDVDEVLQDSSVKAYISLLGFSDEDRARLQEQSWLSKIVRNTAYTSQSQKRREISLDYLSETNYTNVTSRPYDWPEQTVLRAEVEAILEEALKGLYPGDRGVIIRRFYEDMNYEEIARELGIGKRTAIVYAHTARYTLQYRLRGKGVDKDVLQLWDRVCKTIVNPTAKGS